MKILFVCHGNICRSTMAQSVMQNLSENAGLAGYLSIDSRATHEDEIGEPPYYETVRTLKRKFGAEAKFDEKVKFLLEFSEASSSKIIADPYYTRDFERCYDDVSHSCAGLLERLKQIL